VNINTLDRGPVEVTENAGVFEKRRLGFQGKEISSRSEVIMFTLFFALTFGSGGMRNRGNKPTIGLEKRVHKTCFTGSRWRGNDEKPS